MAYLYSTTLSTEQLGSSTYLWLGTRSAYVPIILRIFTHLSEDRDKYVHMLVILN